MSADNTQPASAPGSVTFWLRELEADPSRAAQPLWERYCRKLVELAQGRLRSASRAVADEEDVALSAFDSFCRGVAAGHFPQLTDRNDLWKILITLTVRKTADLIEHENRRKRGGGRRSDPDVALEDVACPEPSPELVAQMLEDYQHLLVRLGDDALRDVAVWKMEGATVEEIATRLGCSDRTVERKLQVIRSIWDPQQESPS